MKHAPAISPHRTNGQLFVQMCNPRRIGKKRKGSVHFACTTQWVEKISKGVFSNIDYWFFTIFSLTDTVTKIPSKICWAVLTKLVAVHSVPNVAKVSKKS